MKGSRELAGASLALLCSSAVLGSCGGATGVGRAVGVGAAFGKGASLAAHIEVRQADAHPGLTLVERQGDPSPGLAAAVVTRAGARVTLDLALVVEDRLEAADVPIHRRVDRDAFFVTTYLGKSDRGKLFEALHRALSTPISPADLQRAEAHAAVLGPLPAEPPELAEVNRCIGRFAVADDKAPPLAAVEAARSRAFAGHRVAFALVGPASVANEAEAAWLASPAWPVGADEPEPPTGAANAVGRSIALPRGAARFTLALPVADGRTAASAASELGRTPSPLRAKLSRLRVPFSVDEIGGVSQPNGGCLFVTATSQTADPAADLAAAVAIATGVAQAELSTSAERPLDEAAAARQVARATDSVEAATIASWWALSHPRAGALSPTAAVLFDAEAPESTLSAARKAATRLPSKVPLALASRVEEGQGELWIALADSCALAEEAPHLWGTAALVAVAASLESPEVDGVDIEPMVDPHGVGVFAHAAARAGESPTDLADRVAAAAASALLGRPISGDDLVEAQSIARTELERRWGHETIGLGPFADALSPEHPVLVEPLGSFAQVSRADADRYQRRWRGFGAGGVGLAVLGNAGDGQASRAAEEIQRWLIGNGSASTCVRSSPTPRPSRTEVHGSGTSHSAWLLFGAQAPDPDLARVARELLDGETEASLSRQALSKVPGATARAWVSDAGALVVTVQSTDELVDDAERAMTALIARIARGDVTEASARDAARAAEDDERRALADPRTRLRLLLSGGALEPAPLATPDILARFKAFAADSLGERRWVVVVAHPD